MNKQEALDLHHNPIEDYSPLYELHHLKQLHISTSNEELAELRRYLPKTVINPNTIQ